MMEKIAQSAVKFYRIYVASIHLELTESDIREVFEAFGPIVSIQLPADLDVCVASAMS